MMGLDEVLFIKGSDLLTHNDIETKDTPYLELALCSSIRNEGGYMLVLRAKLPTLLFKLKHSRSAFPFIYSLEVE